MLLPGAASAATEPAAPPPARPLDRNNFFTTDINSLTEQKWAHINTLAHNWYRLGYQHRFQITASMHNAMDHGKKTPFGLGPGCQANVIELSPQGAPYYIAVPYAIIRGIARIGSAWANDSLPGVQD